MKDPVDLSTADMFSDEVKEISAGPEVTLTSILARPLLAGVSLRESDVVANWEKLHGKMPTPRSWEEAIDQVVDERNDLLEVLALLVRATDAVGLLAPALRRAEKLVLLLQQQDAAREAEFSGKGGNV